MHFENSPNNISQWCSFINNAIAISIIHSSDKYQKGCSRQNTKTKPMFSEKYLTSSKNCAIVNFFLSFPMEYARQLANGNLCWPCISAHSFAERVMMLNVQPFKYILTVLKTSSLWLFAFFSLSLSFVPFNWFSKNNWINLSMVGTYVVLVIHHWPVLGLDFLSLLSLHVFHFHIN